MRRRLWIVGLLLLSSPAGVAAQNSVYGVLGIGFPGRPIGTRTRALGGSAGPFDSRSAVNPATVAGFRRLSITVGTATSLWSYTALDSTVDGLSTTRFPFALLGGHVRGTPVSFAISLATYAERTWDLVTTDSILLRGELVEVSDRLRSRGSVADVRGALAWRISQRLSLGAGIHILSGSSKLTTRRTFSGTAYRALLDNSQVGYSGFGFSGGVMASPIPRITLSGTVRTDGRLDFTTDSVPTGSVELPMTIIGGLFVVPIAALRWSTTVTWQSWSDAAPDLVAAGAGNALDTWDVSSGLEVGSPTGGGIPLRVGFRYAQLPFSPTMDQPREIGLSAGTALGFAGNRGELEFSLERAFRDGAGVEERAWNLSFSLTVRP